MHFDIIFARLFKHLHLLVNFFWLIVTATFSLHSSQKELAFTTFERISQKADLSNNVAHSLCIPFN